MRECGHQPLENPLTGPPFDAQRGTGSGSCVLDGAADRNSGATANRGDVGAAMQTYWLGILSGALLIVDASTTTDRAVLALRRANNPLSFADSSAQASLFGAVVRGKLQKVLAIERGLPPSTIASKLRYMIERMGLDCNISRLPLAVALLAHAVERPELVDTYTDFARSLDSPATCVLLLKRCEHALAPRLSKSEFEIAGQFLEGRSYEAIARGRFTSLRTIANQMSSIFRKTGATGRYGLLRATIEQACVAPPKSTLLPAPPRRVPPLLRLTAPTLEAPLLQPPAQPNHAALAV